MQEIPLFRGAIICSDQEIAEELAAILPRFECIGILRSISRLQDATKVAPFMRATAPEVIFLEVGQGKMIEPIVSAIKSESPHCQLIAIARGSDKTISRRDAQAVGIPELLSYPYQELAVQAVVQRIAGNLTMKPVAMRATNGVFSFLPAKPGVGASTLATNVAIAASTLTLDRSCLIDCDRNNGIIRFLLQLENPFSLVDAIRHAFQLDEVIWPQLVTAYNNLDVLHAGPVEPEFRVEAVHLRQILDFTRRNYDAVFVDLSAEFERFALEVMLASQAIFLIVTPELASIHMAREKLRHLDKLCLLDRVQILMNRAQKRTVVNKENVEDLLQRSVCAQFSNDYLRVNFAVTTGREIDPSSEIGKQFLSFASSILGQSQPSHLGARQK